MVIDIQQIGLDSRQTE